LRKFFLIKINGKSAIFVSDIHLSESDPKTIKSFNHFLLKTCTQHPYLFILGDLFEYWVGDDANHFSETQKILSTISNKTKVFFIAGNRDFLIGKKFLKKNNISKLEDVTEIQLGNQRALLMHGDNLCTTDYQYQIFKFFVRKKLCMDFFLNKPLDYRVRFCEKLRKNSMLSQKDNKNSIIDVNERSVKKMFRKNNWPSFIIHGHTHRLKTHKYQFGKSYCERWVLGDWYGSGNYLLWDKKKLKNLYLS